MGNKVIIGFILTAFLVIGVSLITYFSIRNLLDTVESLSKPNEKLSQLNGLMADVYLLDMSKTERTSDKDSVLEETLRSVEKRLEWLKLNASDSSEVRSFENTSLNISELMVVYAGLEETRYNVVNRNFSEEALKNIERKIKRQQELSEMKFLGKIRNRDLFPVISSEIPIENVPSAKGESIVSKGKHGEIERFLLEIERDFEERKNLDSVSETLNSESALLDLRNLVAQMYKDEQKMQDNFVQLESRLLQKNKEVFAQIQELISNMQYDLLIEYKNQNQSAYDLTYTVSIILALLVFIGLIGSLGFVYSILSEVKKADTYREKLEEAKRHSDTLAKAKQDFLANMSHEIRNPLHAIQGFQKELARSGISAEQKEYVEMIAFASDTLVEIVNDILDFSKLEAGKIKIEKEAFDPYRLFSSIKNIFAVQAEKKKLYFKWDLDFPEGKWILGDQLRINQILSNVLSNALKFTQEGGIKVNIRLLNPQILQIIVKDSGTGITQEVLDDIFQEFTQVILP
jgi:signal transduction histidine kinase